MGGGGGGGGRRVFWREFRREKTKSWNIELQEKIKGIQSNTSLNGD